MTSDRIKLKRGDTIVFKNLSISFRRTDKLPDRPLDAPVAQFDSYTLFPVSQYAERLPDQVSSGGGVMLETSAFEGVIVTFKSTTPYYVRVYTKDANAISGKHVFHESIFRESRDARRQRNMTRQNWQIRKHLEEPSQDYIIVHAQKRLEGFTTWTGHLRRFGPAPFRYGTTTMQHLEGDVVSSSLRFEITPFDTKATYWFQPKGTHSAMKIKTPGDTVLFSAPSDIEHLFHLREWIGDEIGHGCM